MTDREFTTREQQFMHDTLREIARTGDATLAEKALAFIDAPDVRYVVRLDTPNSPCVYDIETKTEILDWRDSSNPYGFSPIRTKAEAEAYAKRLNEVQS